MIQQRYNPRMLGWFGAPDVDLSWPERTRRPLLAALRPEGGRDNQALRELSGYKEAGMALIYTRFEKALTGIENLINDFSGIGVV